MAASYAPQPDSRNLARLFLGLALCTIAILILGFIYGYAWHIWDWLSDYFTPAVSTSGRRTRSISGTALAIAAMFLPLLNLFALIAISALGEKFGNVRNALGKGVLLIWFGLLALCASWLGWFYIKTGQLFLSPLDLWRAITNLAESGLRFGRATRTGWELYVPWVIDGLFAVIGGGIVGKAFGKPA